jgi:SAM-dependent methyltransferase
MMLFVAIGLIVAYFKIPSVFNLVSTQGGNQLVNMPVYTDTIYNLGSYQDLNDRDEFDYQYAISCWVFIDAAPPNTNSNYTKGIINAIKAELPDTVPYKQQLIWTVLRFDFKKSLLDRQHFGTYHQQLGQQLIAIERRDPTAWWLEQKFTPDLSAIRADNLYGAVQDHFLDQWLPRRIIPGLRVLDLGCGAGTIAQKMARLGASVLGVDPNPEYIRLATERAEGNSSFQVLDLNTPGALDALPAASFDCIYMSDALLFYFVPYEPGKPLDLPRFIGDVKRLLKPGGSFLCLEPHPVFYIQPWLGDPSRPFTVMTEYLRTHWRINPPLATLARPFLSAGFTITDIEELASDPENVHVEARAAQFAAEFPVWLLIEFRAHTNG